MADIVQFSPVRALDRNGDTIPGAKATFFASGTTTPATVFSDLAEVIPHPSPLLADGRGIFPAVYYSGGALRVVVTDENDVVLPGYPIDPALIVAGTNSGAALVSFAPTVAIPVTNVQAAIERVQSNLVAPLAEFGLGVTGSATLLANFDLTNIPSGFYRFDATTTGARPFDGSLTGTVSFTRENVNSGLMIATPRDGGQGVWYRSLIAGTWGGWVRIAQTNSPTFTGTTAVAALTASGAATFSGVTIVPTEGVGSNNTRAANTAFVAAEINFRAPLVTAALAAGAVGTYVTARNFGAGVPFGGFTAGSNLQPATTAGGTIGGPLSGTWQCMGRAGTNETTTWLRVS